MGQKDAGRDPSGASRSHGRLRIAGNPRSWERQGIDSPSGPLGGTSPAETLVSEFWPPEQ